MIVKIGDVYLNTDHIEYVTRTNFEDGRLFEMQVYFDNGRLGFVGDNADILDALLAGMNKLEQRP